MSDRALDLGMCVRQTEAAVLAFCQRTGLDYAIRLSLLRGTVMDIEDDGTIFIHWDDGEVGRHSPSDIEECEDV